MAKGLSQLSGKVRVRGFSRLDSDRYTFLGLDQAEPNVGLPADSGGLFQSALDGTRSLTKSISINEIFYEANQLDSVVGGNERFIIGIADPTVRNPLGIISINELLSDSGQAADTLQKVTEAGDSTSLAITIGGLSLTFADSDPTTTSLLVRNLLTDSVGVRSFGSLADEAGLLQDGDVASLSGLSLTAIDSDPDTTVVLVINEQTDSVGKRSFESLADDLGLIQQGDRIEASGLTLATDSDPDSLTVLVKDLQTDSVGIRSFESLADDLGLIRQGDRIDASGLTLRTDSDSDTNQVLVLNLATDSVGIRSFESLVDDTDLIEQGDDITAGSLSITTLDSNPNTNQVLVVDLATDSIGKRSFDSLATEAGLIAQGDDINAGGLTISQADSDPTTTSILVLNETTDSVGIRSFASLAEEANIGADTLQTVTDRGDSTDSKIVIGGLVLTRADSDATTTSVLVKNLATDSVGIRSFTNLIEEVGLELDTLQTVTDRGDSTDNTITLKSGLITQNLPVDNTTTNILVLTAEDSVAQRTFASLAATEADTLQDVMTRGDSTTIDMTIREASLTADSVKANVGFFDTNNNQLIIYDSAGAVLWGA